MKANSYAPVDTASAADERAVRQHLLLDAGVIVVYVWLGLVAFAPLRPWTSTRVAGIGADPVLGTWSLAWVSHALGHGINPLFSNTLYAPAGVQVAQSSPLLGAFTGLLAPLLSPVARGNVLMVLAMPVSASAAYFVLRKWEVWAPAAAIGGLVYGFSPFEIGQALGHLGLVFLPFPPLIALALVSVVRRQGDPIRLGIRLGLLLAAQFLISAEIFVMCVVLAALVLGSMALRHRAHAVEHCVKLLKPFASAAVVTGLVIAIPTWMFVSGPRHVTGAVHPVPSPYYNDLLSFIRPGPLQRVSLEMPPSPLHLNAAENDGYIGIPILILAMALAWRSRRTSRTQIAVLLTVWAAILSLGSRLSVNGHLSNVPLPFDALWRIPLFDNLLPSRFAFATTLGLAAVIAFGLDDLRYSASYSLREWQPTRANVFWSYNRSSVVCVIALVALVVTQLPRWPYESRPAHVLPPQIGAAIPDGNPIAVTYPYPSYLNTDAMVWQMQDGFSFRLIGGYALTPKRNGRPNLLPNLTNPPDLAAYLVNVENLERVRHIPKPPTNSLVTATRVALAKDDVRLVMVDQAAPGGPLALTLFERALGRPKVRSGSFALWATAKGPL